MNHLHRASDGHYYLKVPIMAVFPYWRQRVLDSYLERPKESHHHAHVYKDSRGVLVPHIYEDCDDGTTIRYTTLAR